MARNPLQLLHPSQVEEGATGHPSCYHPDLNNQKTSFLLFYITEAYKTEGNGYARKATHKKNNVFKEALRNRWCTGVSIVSFKPFISSISRLWQPLTSQRPSNLRPTVRISSRNLQCPAPGTSPAKPQSESSTDTIAQLFQWGTFPSWGAVLV